MTGNARHCGRLSRAMHVGRMRPDGQCRVRGFSSETKGWRSGFICRVEATVAGNTVVRLMRMAFDAGYLRGATGKISAMALRAALSAVLFDDATVEIGRGLIGPPGWVGIGQCVRNSILGTRQHH